MSSFRYKKTKRIIIKKKRIKYNNKTPTEFSAVPRPSVINPETDGESSWREWWCDEGERGGGVKKL